MKHCLDIIVAALVLSGLTACMNLPEANSQKPDEVLFVHAVGAIQRQKQAVAQISLQTFRTGLFSVLPLSIRPLKSRVPH